MADHPSLAELQQFVLGEATSQKMLEIVRHLSRGCDVCRESLYPLSALLFRTPRSGRAHQVQDTARRLDGSDAVDASQASLASEGIDAALDAAIRDIPRLQAAWHPSQGALRQRLLTRLDGATDSSPQALESLLDRPSAVPASGAVVRTCIEIAHELSASSPDRMLRAALLAHAVAQRLDPRSEGRNAAADHRAWALAELANARRVKDDLDGAWRDVRRAQALLESGSGDPYLQAHVAEIEAAIRADRRDLRSALRILDRCFRTYMALGERHCAGRTLISKAIQSDIAGDPAQAITLLQLANELIDSRRDPRLAASAQQNHLYFLTQAGQYHAAAAYLLESGLRQKLADRPLSLAKLRWVEGQILRGLKRLDKAEAAFLAARQTFRDHDSRYNAALVGLQLAEVWSLQGNLERVREVAGETLQVFEELGVQREARVAVQFLRATCHIQHAVPEVVQRVNRFLTRLEVQPELAFEKFLTASA